MPCEREAGLETCFCEPSHILLRAPAHVTALTLAPKLNYKICVFLNSSEIYRDAAVGAEKEKLSGKSLKWREARLAAYIGGKN